MAAWLGECQCVGPYTSIYKLACRPADHERDILLTHIIETYAEGGMFF